MELTPVLNGGIKPFEMTIMYAVRNTGKSYLQKMLMSSMYGKLGIEPPKQELELEENRVHGSRYYTVKPVHYNWHELEQWCIETFGEPGSVWIAHDFTWPEMPRWLMNNSKIWFRNEKDRSWFIMKWAR